MLRLAAKAKGDANLSGEIVFLWLNVRSTSPKVAVRTVVVQRESEGMSVT